MLNRGLNLTWSIAIVSIRTLISSLAFYFQRGVVETLTAINLSDDGNSVTCAWREIVVVVQAIDGYSLNEGSSLLRNESHVIVLFYAAVSIGESHIDIPALLNEDHQVLKKCFSIGHRASSR
jgi:hypothetical protein